MQQKSTAHKKHSNTFLTQHLSSNKPIDFVVVTCFINFCGKLLILQRGRKDAQYELWGVPGGKLAKNENPKSGLAREIEEETKMKINSEKFIELSIAFITNPYDGHYKIYLYYLELDSSPKIVLNNNEHLAYQWVKPENFMDLNLLVSQGHAYKYIENKLLNLINQTKPSEN